jgi:hypothetical protein
MKNFIFGVILGLIIAMIVVLIDHSYKTTNNQDTQTQTYSTQLEREWKNNMLYPETFELVEFKCIDTLNTKDIDNLINEYSKLSKKYLNEYDSLIIVKTIIDYDDDNYYNIDYRILQYYIDINIVNREINDEALNYYISMKKANATLYNYHVIIRYNNNDNIREITKFIINLNNKNNKSFMIDYDA